MKQLQAAVASHDQGDLDQAEVIYRKILSVDTDNFHALRLLGCLMSYKGFYQSAISLLRQAIAVSSCDTECWFNLGNAYRGDFRFQEAIVAYRSAEEYGTTNPQVFNNWGRCLQRLSKQKESIPVLEKAVSIDESCFGAWFALGNSWRDIGEVSRAVFCYMKSIDASPSFMDSYLNLGVLLQDEGRFEEAIASYRKAIEVKPDFADAYLNLGNVLKDVGRMDQLRQIVDTLRRMKPLEDEALIAIEDKILVFDWHHRRALNLFWDVELASAGMEFASLTAVKKVDALCFPPLFLGGQTACAELKIFYKTGYLVDEDLVSPDICADLISQFNDENESVSEALVEAVLANGVLRSALERVFIHTGFPHVIWSCIYYAKGPEDKSVSDSWHYDNHYNQWTPKLMLYLNSQKDEGGATHFVDAGLSRQLSEKSDYMGLIFQRESYENLVKPFVEELSLDPVTLDPEHYVFSPESAGSGVWFCPARALHRGVSPDKGVRHVLSFSLTPLPVDCEWSIDQCVEKSVEILKDNIKRGMQKTDVNPYWMAGEVGSD